MSFSVYPPLPRRVRARLRTERCIDRLGCWLCGRGCTAAAILLWRVCGMWS
jgi:hypothetical protein